MNSSERKTIVRVFVSLSLSLGYGHTTPKTGRDREKKHLSFVPLTR